MGLTVLNCRTRPVMPMKSTCNESSSKACRDAVVARSATDLPKRQGTVLKSHKRLQVLHHGSSHALTTDSKQRLSMMGALMFQTRIFQGPVPRKHVGIQDAGDQPNAIVEVAGLLVIADSFPPAKLEQSCV